MPIYQVLENKRFLFNALASSKRVINQNKIKIVKLDILYSETSLGIYLKDVHGTLRNIYNFLYKSFEILL